MCTPENVRRVEDWPPYQRPRFDEAKNRPRKIVGRSLTLAALASKNAVARARAPPGRSKFSFELQGFVRADCRAGSACTKLWPTCKSSLQPNQKRCWSTALQKPLVEFFAAETLRRRESVGRAVHCAPEPLASARPIGLNLVFHALTSAAATSRGDAELG